MPPPLLALLTTADACVGSPLTDKATVPLNPFSGATLIVLPPAPPPANTVKELGLGEMLNPGSGICNTTVVELLTPFAVPVTVTE
jgi:hypothetical protein